MFGSEKISKMSKKSIYRIISKREDGNELFEILENNKIEFSLIQNAFEVDTTFSGSPYQAEIQILLDPADFERVDLLMADLAKSQLDLSDRNHYLYRFTTKELLDLLREKDEWSVYDFELAKVILNERGEDVSDARLKSLDEERMEILSAGESGPAYQIAIGYIAAFLGGILGVLIGWYLWKSKRTLPNGDIVNMYNVHQRKHGRMIFNLGVIVWIFIFSIYLTYAFSKIR